MDDYILNYNDFLNESKWVQVLAKNSYGYLKVAIKGIPYDCTVSDSVIRQFERMLHGDQGYAIKYLERENGGPLNRLIP